MKSWLRPAAIGAIFLIDRATKVWALRWLMPRGSVELLPFFHLTYVENTGAAFGIGAARNNFFVALTVVLLGVLLYLQRAWREKNAWLQAGLTLVIGGAIANLYDRVVYGFVVDFLDLRVWPVFNVADSCISIGAVCLAWGLRLDEKAEKAAVTKDV